MYSVILILKNGVIFIFKYGEIFKFVKHIC